MFPVHFYIRLQFVAEQITLAYGAAVRVLSLQLKYRHLILLSPPKLDIFEKKISTAKTNTKI